MILVPAKAFPAPQSGTVVVPIPAGTAAARPALKAMNTPVPVSARMRETASYTGLSVNEYVYAKIQKELRPTHPQLASLLNGCCDPHTDRVIKAYDRKLLAVIPPLLRNLHKLRGRERQLVLMAIDFVGLDLAVLKKNLPLKTLSRYGMHYHYYENWRQWNYNHDFLWEVWQEHPNTELGKDAFVLLLQSGFDPSLDCHYGPNNFLRIIHYAEPWIRAHPNDPRNLYVRYILAEAYHTWWVLGHAVNASVRKQYEKGSDAAYGKSIGYYQQVIAGATTMLNDHLTGYHLDSYRAILRREMKRIQNKQKDFSVFWCLGSS